MLASLSSGRPERTGNPIATEPYATAAEDSISRTVRVTVSVRSSAEGRAWRTLAGRRRHSVRV
jgi:hypothetical protein